MIEQDTIKLLRECDAGIKMGVKSIADVLDRVESPELKHLLNACKDEHDKLDKELQELLGKYEDEGKDPNIIAEAMAKMKTEVKLQMHENDNTICNLYALIIQSRECNYCCYLLYKSVFGINYKLYPLSKSTRKRVGTVSLTASSDSG